jgi:hypothetical protein
MSMTCERIQLCDKVCPWLVKGYNFVIKYVHDLYFITKLYPFTSHGHTLPQSCILSQVMDILYHKVVSFHKSWTYFITKLYPFTSHGHTLLQSCILSQVMDIRYHKFVSFHKSWTYFRIQLCDKICPWLVKGYNFVIKYVHDLWKAVLSSAPTVLIAEANKPLRSDLNITINLLLSWYLEFDLLPYRSDLV